MKACDWPTPTKVAEFEDPKQDALQFAGERFIVGFVVRLSLVQN